MGNLLFRRNITHIIYDPTVKIYKCGYFLHFQLILDSLEEYYVPKNPEDYAGEIYSLGASFIHVHVHYWITEKNSFKRKTKSGFKVLGPINS